MDSRELRTALGKLQVEPDAEPAWTALREAVSRPAGDLSPEECLHLLQAARNEHAQRGEWFAVAHLLEIAASIASGSEQEADLVALQAKVLSEELYDDDGAGICYLRLLELRPDYTGANSAIEESQTRRRRQHELVEGYLEEAERGTDDVYKSSMLMRASEIEVRAGAEEASLATIERLERAVRLDPTNERAGKLLEHVYRRARRWEELAGVLERMADRGEHASERVAAGVRLARVYAGHLGDPERSARAYDRVLRESADHPEAMSFLSELYSSQERWGDLVEVYERELKSKDLHDAARLGDMLQIAMLYWKKLGRPADAEPWFERIRKVDPTNEVMLSFYREYCTTLEDDTRLMDILQGAQRALKGGSKEKALLAQEIGHLAEGQANAAKAIEQYKSVLRQDPDNAEARERLKSLYKQTQAHNALVELLRQLLERTPQDHYAERLQILRDVATVYRQYQKSDTALLSVLNQIVQLDDKLDEHDVGELREIVLLYEKLGRFRELLAHQLKLADVTPDVAEKQVLYRAAARRWLEQFSNVQNATEAYAKLLQVAPDDPEARQRLDELYRKRRAWSELYELYASSLDRKQGVEKLSLLREMAQLAAERLNRPADAIALYRQILDVDPTRVDVLDALEKHAERNKDWATLAEALERRAAGASDDTQRLAALQKLGSVYSEHLGDANRAAAVWRRVLELSPGHNRALRVLRESYLAFGDYDGLEELYAGQSDWEGLAEVLSNAADRAKETRARVELSYRTARVLEERLRQPDRAFRSYERILAADPSDARAARALLPLYEKDEKWSRLPALYELLLENSSETEVKLRFYSKLVETVGRWLGDRKSAASYARRAYELDPRSPVALELLEETSRAAGTWETFVEVITKRLEAEFEPGQVGAEPKRKGKKRRRGGEPRLEGERLPEPEKDTHRRLLELKLARVYAEELHRVDAAVGVYKRLLESDPGDLQALQQLEVILRREDRQDDLRWLLELKVDSATDEMEVRRLLSEFAFLEEEAFGSPERAVLLYRRLLELDPTDEGALRALPRLLLGLGDPAGAAEVLARHRDLSAGETRAEREVELAELYLEKLGLPAPALESAVQALGAASTRARAVTVLEALVHEKQARRRAAEVLADHYATLNDARKEVDALNIVLSETQDPSERLELFKRLSESHEQKLASQGSALEAIMTAVREFPAELSLWDRADALASAAGRPIDLADAYRDVLRSTLSIDLETVLSERASRVHEDRLGDPLGAIPYLERVLGLAPGNETAFQRLKDILTAGERWGELEAMYDRATVATEDLPRRIEMLVEVALICEEIIEDSSKATRYHEQILKLDPLHEGAIHALDRLYQRQGRDSELAALLTRRLEIVVGDEALDIQLRLAKLELDLHKPELAVVHLEDVLRARVGDYEARALAERMLEIGMLRKRAACMLESVYQAKDEVRELVRVLEIRLEGLETGGQETKIEQRELLRRVAKLRDERLHEDEGALDAFARLVPLDPLDGEARSRLMEIGRRQGAHERVARVLTQGAQAADTPTLRGEILMHVAGIYEEQIADRGKAEQVYREILEIDKNDPELALPAARALERLHLAAGDNQKLSEIFRIQVALEQDAVLRRRLLGRLGELCERELLDKEGAIEAWKQRSDETPEDDEALAALDRLYEKTERFREMVVVVAKRRDVSSDEDLRRAFLARIAQTLWKRLDSTSEAIDAYQTLLVEYGPEGETLRSLEALYQSEERWDDLAETYDRHIDAAVSDGERLELLARLGDLKRESLGDVTSALEAYRRALAIDSSHAASRSALEKLLESEDLHARRAVAQVLLPILEKEGAHQKLLRVLEIQIETAEDAHERLSGLEAALRIADGSLGDSARAFSFAERGLRQAVGHGDLLPWFERLERLAGPTGRQADYVRLLCEVVPNVFDGDVQLEVTLKIAHLARHQLADRELSREYYKKALELRPDDRRVLSALESLYEESGDAPSLLEILERRVEAADDVKDRKQLMFRRARLLADVLEDKPRAIEVYEAILDLGQEGAAIDALEVLYTSVERWSDLIKLYERELDNKIGSAADGHVNIARIAARHLGDVERAFEELEQALKIDKQHVAAIAELERLLSQASEAEHRARAAALLEPVYLIRSDFGRVMETIRARLEYASDPQLRRGLLTRLAKLYEEQKEDYPAALETVAKLFHEDIGDPGANAELERLAKVANAEQRLAEIYAAELAQIEIEDANSAQLLSRTGQLFDGLGQADRALEFYRRAFKFDPENQLLFQAINQILTRLARHEERVSLYRDALEYRLDPSNRIPLLHTIAALERRELGRLEQAIETYRAALEMDENDTVSLDALTELFRERERWEELGELYLERAEGASDMQIAAQFRLALARLEMQRGRTDRAVDQLEEIVQVLPQNKEALAELEALRKTQSERRRVVEILRPLYEAADDWRHRITLNEDRYALAETAPERVLVLRETAELWERRGGDSRRARRALEAAVRIDPDDSEVRAEYERLTEGNGAWDQLARTYEDVLAERTDLPSRREILLVLAEVHNVRRDDPRRALDAYDRLRATDETDIEPLDKMEGLATLLSDWTTLVRVLTAKADLLLDDAERASVWRRVGEAKRDMLEDRRGAVQAYERSLELEPESAFTIDSLIELYANGKDPRRLVELYQRRVELVGEGDEDLEYQLLTAAAVCYEQELSDRPRAIEALVRALELRPSDEQVAGSLNRLYRAEGSWPELLETLRVQIGRAKDGSERATLEKEIAEVLADKLGSYDEALDACRRALDEVPTDAAVVARVLALGEQHEDLRRAVADVLVPVLQQTERWQDLADVLELRLSVEQDPLDRVQSSMAIAQVFETRLSRPQDAMNTLLRALSDRPASEELHAEIERFAGASGDWERYAEALSERASSIFDPDLAKDLYVRLGRIAEERLRDDQRAVDAISKAVEQTGDMPELLDALDRLYSRLGSHAALMDVLERRVMAPGSDRQKAELYYRLASLQGGEFKETARALASLRLALESNPDHEPSVLELEKLTEDRDLFDEAAEVLEEVYRSRGRADRLARLYEKRVAFAESVEARVAMSRDLARVLEDEVKNPKAAQQVIEQGVIEAPEEGDLLRELERLAGVTDGWGSASDALAKAIKDHPQLDPESVVNLCTRLASWLRDEVRDPEGAERALLRALESDPENDDVLEQLESLQRASGHKRELLATLRRRGKLQVDPDRRERLFTEAKSVAESLNDPAAAEQVLRDLLVLDDTNPWALENLTVLCELARDYKETFALLVRRSELSVDAGAVRALRSRAAIIARDKLSDPVKAIELFDQLLEDDPTDDQVAHALHQLYREGGRDRELLRLLERRIDVATSPGARSMLRLELAELNLARFDAPNAAIDVLQALIEEEPGHAQAVVRLSELLEKTQRDEELAELLESQIEAARARGDLTAELAFQVRLGDVSETRLGNRARAIDTYRAVIEREPRHLGALESLARLLRTEGRNEEAAEILGRQLECAPTEQAVQRALELSSVYEDLGSQDRAIAVLERVLETNQQDSGLRVTLRSLYEKLGEWGKLADLGAREAEFAETPERAVQILREAAQVLATKRGEHDKAAELLERASRLRPDNREVLLELCDRYRASGRGKEAAQVLERIVQSFGSKRTRELAEIHRRLADAYLDQGDSQRAILELDKAFRIEPGNIHVLTLLGDVAFKAQDYKKAQQMYRALLLQKLDDGGPTRKSLVFLRLGEIHEGMGEKPKAIQMYERAVQTDGLEEAKSKLRALKT